MKTFLFSKIRTDEYFWEVYAENKEEAELIFDKLDFDEANSIKNLEIKTEKWAEQIDETLPEEIDEEYKKEKICDLIAEQESRWGEAKNIYQMDERNQPEDELEDRQEQEDNVSI